MPQTEAVLFPPDDVTYEKWRQEHPDHFVLNTNRSYTKSSSVIHRASCSLLDAAAKHTAPGQLTGGDYYKVRAASVDAARKWLLAKRTTTSARLCPTCFRNEIQNAGRDGQYGFAIGAVYNRTKHIHNRFGGQAQGGISTPQAAPLVILFTGEVGKGHGYDDEWDEDGLFHYVGEGQRGDMRYAAGNLAIEQHIRSEKALLLFQALGKEGAYRFMGRFELVDSYQRPNVPDTDGNLRAAIVFKLKPTLSGPSDGEPALTDEVFALDSVDVTTAERTIQIRTKQDLFRRRVSRIERGCRITGVRDLRFLRASHIKPWSVCESPSERVDGNNGLLLAPHVDLLFDAGWISFGDDGLLLLSSKLPADVVQKYGLNLSAPMRCGSFTAEQRRYLAFHRNHVFDP